MVFLRADRALVGFTEVGKTVQVNNIIAGDLTEVGKIAREQYQKHKPIEKIATEHDFDILKLDLLGWSQDEIALLVGLESQSVVSDIIATDLTEVSKIGREQYQKSKPIEKIASEHDFDLPLPPLLHPRGDSYRVSEGVE